MSLHHIITCHFRCLSILSCVQYLLDKLIWLSLLWSSILSKNCLCSVSLIKNLPIRHWSVWSYIILRELYTSGDSLLQACKVSHLIWRDIWMAKSSLEVSSIIFCKANQYTNLTTILLHFMFPSGCSVSHFFSSLVLTPISPFYMHHTEFHCFCHSCGVF